MPAPVALLVVGVLATLVLVSLPILVAGMTAAFQWDDRYIGWLASADMAGSAIASLWVMRHIARIRWRATALRALAVVVAGNLLSIAAQGFVSLAAARVLTGCGNGLILAIVFVGLCHSRSPERLFGAYVLAQLTLQALALALLPRLIEAQGMAGVYAVLATVSAASALLVRFFPADLQQCTAGPHAGPRADGAAAADAARGAPHPARAALGLAAQGLYFLAPGATWGYLERIGASFALGGGAVGEALGAASFAGIAGALTVMLVGGRFRGLIPLGLGVAVSVLATILLMDGTGFARYLLAAALFNFAWNFTFPYQMGILARLDRAGSVATSSLVVQLCALAAGPLLASFLVGGARFEPVLWACAGAYAVSFCMFAGGAVRAGGGALPVRTHG